MAATKIPIWRTRNGHFRRNEVPYTEWFWGQINQPVAHQIGDTSAVHVLVRATEFRYLLHYKKKNEIHPFDRLCVEHIENRVATFIGQNKVTEFKPKYLGTQIIQNEGILAAEDYCLPNGLRGENSWLPHERIPQDARRYRTEGDYWWNIHDVTDMTPQEKHQAVVRLVEEGPIYVDFFVPDDYVNNDGFPHGFKNPPPDTIDNFTSHAVMLVGYGWYTDDNGQCAFYFLYLNTLGPGWGDRGYGRILAHDMSGIYDIWVPRVPAGSTSRSSIVD